MTTYLTDSNGKFIPASQRPDGTWRKARRVRDGYVPQEEVPLYESKGKQFANRKGNGVPPGVSPFVVDAARKERQAQERAKAAAAAVAFAAAASAASTANKKPKPKQVVSAKPKAASGENKLVSGLQKLTLEDRAAELNKKIKKWRKKLREIDAIEEKMTSGQFKPDKDQMEKIKKKSEIIGELERLAKLEEHVKHHQPQTEESIDY